MTTTASKKRLHFADEEGPTRVVSPEKQLARVACSTCGIDCRPRRFQSQGQGRALSSRFLCADCATCVVCDVSLNTDDDTFQLNGRIACSRCVRYCTVCIVFHERSDFQDASDREENLYCQWTCCGCKVNYNRTYELGYTSHWYCATCLRDGIAYGDDDPESAAWEEMLELLPENTDDDSTLEYPASDADE